MNKVERENDRKDLVKSAINSTLRVKSAEPVASIVAFDENLISLIGAVCVDLHCLFICAFASMAVLAGKMYSRRRPLV